MKKISAILLIFVLTFSMAITACAQSADNYETYDCHVKVGGTQEFQTWDVPTKYTVADESIATVDENGVVHGKKVGHTTVDVVIYDEDYASWIAGGYSFTEDIYVYQPVSEMSFGKNCIEGSATFTPTESGYYSFTGNADHIIVSAGSVKYWPSANYHDIIDYYPMSDIYLKGGVTYTVTANNYDESFDMPDFNITVKKSISAPLSVKKVGSGVEISVENTYNNKYGKTVYAVLRKTAGSDWENVGYITQKDQRVLTFTDTSVSAGTEYTYTVGMVDEVGNTTYLCEFDTVGKGVVAATPVLSPKTGDTENIIPFICAAMFFGMILGVFILGIKMRKTI
ncbi:MAG: Ig-like domain-containing protein [Clostridia bacterium]|nr:Ig-like domain-containing protein [Clostridia bacterium]